MANLCFFIPLVDVKKVEIQDFRKYQSSTKSRIFRWISGFRSGWFAPGTLAIGPRVGFDRTPDVVIFIPFSNTLVAEKKVNVVRSIGLPLEAQQSCPEWGLTDSWSFLVNFSSLWWPKKSYHPRFLKMLKFQVGVTSGPSGCPDTWRLGPK